jgi:hypothetical protein
MNTAVRTGKGMRRLLAVATTLVALAAASSGAATAAPASASGDGSLLGCGHEATHPFLRWLDPLPYTLLPGGDFESGAAGWKLSKGARVVSGNEPFDVGRTGGSNSLLLPAGSSATSPPMCMGLLLPVVRYFSTGGNLLSYLRVEAVYKDARGRERSIDLLPGGLPTKSWAPSLPALQLMGLLNVLTLDGLTSDIALRFTPKGLLFGSGTWRIDDIYVDPWKVV